MCIVVSDIVCGPLQRDQNASRKHGSIRRRITTKVEKATCCYVPDAAALCCCRKAHIPLNVSRRQHESGLFSRRPVVCVYLSTECGCIGPVNIVDGVGPLTL
ncbi:hypothetical protein AVEN_3215-1 [Araneus ventricosus]|uniref:Uncharacterized protein n=1 Tax=Araneus ventricosus TaxID=182803 RepID=A0A4Y2GA85_ARAVE|nr:hypothetical protein AVEN_3215-1 [Araneus ventricosus]